MLVLDVWFWTEMASSKHDTQIPSKSWRETPRRCPQISVATTDGIVTKPREPETKHATDKRKQEFTDKADVMWVFAHNHWHRNVESYLSRHKRLETSLFTRAISWRWNDLFPLKNSKEINNHLLYSLCLRAVLLELLLSLILNSWGPSVWPPAVGMFPARRQ